MSNDTVLSEVPYSYFINLLPMDASRFVYLTEWWQVDLNLMPKGVAFVTLVTLLNPFQASPFAFFCKQLNACATLLFICAFARNCSKLWTWAGNPGKFEFVNYTKSFELIKALEGALDSF